MSFRLEGIAAKRRAAPAAPRAGCPVLCRPEHRSAQAEARTIMNDLFSTAILFLVLSSHRQDLPQELSQVPEQIREKATVIVKGTYGRGRTPCFFRPDGTREWFVDSWFQVKRVYRGQVGHGFIRINTAMLPKTEYVSEKLERDRAYLVLLRPRPETMKMIKTKEGISFWDALREEEIVAIVKLK